MCAGHPEPIRSDGRPGAGTRPSLITDASQRLNDPPCRPPRKPSPAGGPVGGQLGGPVGGPVGGHPRFEFPVCEWSPVWPRLSDAGSLGRHVCYSQRGVPSLRLTHPTKLHACCTRRVSPAQRRRTGGQIRRRRTGRSGWCLWGPALLRDPGVRAARPGGLLDPRQDLVQSRWPEPHIVILVEQVREPAYRRVREGRVKYLGGQSVWPGYCRAGRRTSLSPEPRPPAERTNDSRHLPEAFRSQRRYPQSRSSHV